MRNAARFALLVAFAVVAACGGGDGSGPSDPVPTSIAVSAGNNQSATVGTALPIAPTVIVKDQRGNGIPGIVVTFAVLSGGGTVGGAQLMTDQGGLAQVGSWILGTATGPNTLGATVQGLTPITFTATATAGAAASLVFVTAPATTAANGAVLAPAPRVQVKDQFGNDRTQAGYMVTVAIATGGGVLGGTATVATNASGVATFANLTLTGTVGARTLSFSGTGVPALLSGAIQLTSGIPATLAAATPTTLAGTVGAAVGSAVTVTATDQSGNPVAGAQVTFAVTAGGGSITGATQTTDAAGQATLGSWTLGTVAGTLNTVSATLGALPAVVFSGTPVAAAASQILMVTQPGTISAVNGAQLDPQPAIQIADQFGNPVAQVSAVTAAIASGGGTLNGTTTLNTAADGSLSFSDLAVLGLNGSRTLGFSAAGLTSATSAGFTTTSGPATTMAVSAGDGQSATVGSPVAIPPAVVITDQSGNPVAGVSVSFGIATGGGIVLGGSPTTGVDGIATVGGWTLGSIAGTNTLTASVPGLSGSPVTFTATGTPAAASALSLETAPSNTATNGIVLAQQPAVQLRDQFGNAVSQAGVVITAGIGSGGGNVAGNTTATTNAGGLATFSGLIVNGLVGTPQVLSFSGSGLTSVASGNITMVAGAAAQLQITTSPSSTALNGLALAQQPVLQVTDAGGNPVATAINVTAAIGSGGGTLGGTMTVLSSAGGVATFTNLSITGLVGNRTLAFSAAGLTGATSGSIALTAGAATTIAASSTTSQSAIVGTAVATPPAVLVTDQSGNPVSGTSVTFTVTGGGGSVTGGSASTAANGIAVVGSWTLGNVLGANSVTASSAGLVGSPVTFAATGTAGAPANVSINAGDGQSATVATAVAIAPGVAVTDQFGNPASGVSVTFAVTSGGGSLIGATPLTDAGGIATLGSWTLGTLAGANALSATVIGVPAVNFTATGTAGAASTLAISAGNGQTATVNSAVAVAPAVLVTDQFGNPVSGIAVTFAVVSGGGSLTGGAAVSNGSGIATVGSWTLGTVSGSNTLSATAAGLSGSPATFTATGTAAAATTMALNAGDGQTAVVGTAVSTVPSVLITDQFGNGVAGVSVTFAVASGGGSVTGGAAQTNASGIAAAGSWTLGTVAGANSVTATSAGLTGSPVTFNATAQAGTATTIIKTAGDNQIATVNSAVTVDPSVQVTDQFGNPLAGVTVTFAVTSGNGSVGGGIQVTDGGGLATVGSWTLGTGAGSNTLSATVSGLPAASFTATGAADAATTIAASAGNGQSATVNTAVAVNPEVLVTDQFGNPVSGVVVNFNVTGGAGSIAGASGTTDALGHATGGSWTLGQTVGANTLDATSGVLAGSPVTFTATGTAAPAAKLTITTQPSANVINGAVLAQQPVLQLRDAFDNPVSQAGVSVSAGASAGGTLSGTTSVSTNAGGQASFTNLALTGLVGNYTLSFSATGLTGATSGSIALSAGAAASIALNGGDGQTATVNTAVSTAPSVVVRDAGTNPVSGVSVTFAVGLGGGSITSGAATTNASGIATVGSWSLGTIAGSNTLTATSGGLSGSPVPFTATGVAGAATSVTAQSVTSQNGRVGIPATALPSVLVRDQFNNPVPGASATFAVAAGGGSVAGGSQTTDGLGLATVTSWTFGKTVVTNTVTATVGALPTVNFDATVTFEVASVAGGGVHNCAVTVDGVGYCWGDNAVGAIGDSSATGPRLAPVPVASSVSFSQLGLGAAHSCGVASNAAAYCWGDNSQRQLGDGSTAASRLAPVSVASGTYSKIAGGFDHTCAIEVAGTMRCWGANGQGQLGRGTTGGGPFNTPQVVALGFSYTQVSTGTFFTCAVRTTGAAYCWGDNAFGQLGDSTKVDKNSPTAIKGGLLFSQVVASQVHACGLTTGGLVYCWGDNTSGRIGQDPGLVSGTTGPIQVAGLSGILQLVEGEGHTCARDSLNQVFCWGLNQVGQLGDGNSGAGVFSFAPVAVVLPGGVGFTSITAGSQFTCGVTAAKASYCWGEGNSGQIGDGAGLDQPLPSLVINP